MVETQLEIKEREKQTFTVPILLKTANIRSRGNFIQKLWAKSTIYSQKFKLKNTSKQDICAWPIT